MNSDLRAKLLRWVFGIRPRAASPDVHQAASDLDATIQAIRSVADSGQDAIVAAHNRRAGGGTRHS